MGRLLDSNRPLVALALLSVLSLGVRAAWLGAPCRSPCRSGTDHVLVFDESYYVNAARVIAGIRPPPGAPYASAPSGYDPNAEHPQLVKLMTAGAIELLGDGPLAWRLGSLVFGTLAILGLYALVRAAGGGSWLAVGAAALLALDNLQLVHGRIDTLDVYVLSAMLWGAALYVRRRPLLAGAMIGLGSTMKLVAPYALVVLAVLEALHLACAPAARDRLLPALRGAARRLASCALAGAGTFIATLAVLDQMAPPWDDTLSRPVSGGVFGHLRHMVSYATSQSSPGGPHGIASYPWQWLGDYKPITYLNVNPAQPSPDLIHAHPACHFLGVVSPPILLLATPALALVVAQLVGGRRRDAAAPAGALASLALAWSLGTFLPFELLSLIWNRTSYLYYMMIVLPGIYIAVVVLIARLARYRALIGLWAVAVVLAAVILYPFTPLP